MLSIAPADLSPGEAYRLLTSLVVPRPIAWVSSLGADGTPNLAPFSFFNAVAGSPPTLMISVGQRQGRPKDTLRNIQETGEFVVHIVDETLAEKMVLTSGEYAYDIDEVALVGLATVPSSEVRPVRLADAMAAFECRKTQLVPVSGSTYTLVLGQILRIHLGEGLLRENGLADSNLIRPVARLGGDEFASLGRIYEMARPIPPERGLG